MAVTAEAPPPLNDEPQSNEPNAAAAPRAAALSRRSSARIVASTRQPHVELVHHLTIREARRAHGDRADAALMEELKSLIGKKAFSPITRRSSSVRPIRSSAFLKERFGPDGVFQRLKARLVANGSQQDRSMYDDLSSPTVGMPALFATATIAAKERRTVTTFDIGTAYLNAEMTGHDVVMILDPNDGWPTSADRRFLRTFFRCQRRALRETRPCLIRLCAVCTAMVQPPKGRPTVYGLRAERS
jgi:hypothetical protein